MSTAIVQCDQCGKVVKQKDAHGWVDVRVWVTKPTNKEFEDAMRSLEGQMAMEDAEPAPRPPIEGGDFCQLYCLVKFYEGQQDRKVEEEPKAPETLGPYI